MVNTIRHKVVLATIFLTFKCEEERRWASYSGSLCGSVTGSLSGSITDAKGCVMVT